MRNTFSKFVLASAIVAAAAFTSIPAMAAVAGAATVNVPFSFTVHGKSLPAGSYQVRWENGSSFVTMQSKDTVESFLWNPYETAKADARVTMRFELQGENRALQSIQYGTYTTPRLTKKTKKNEDITPVYGSTGQ